MNFKKGNCYLDSANIVEGQEQTNDNTEDEPEAPDGDNKTKMEEFSDRYKIGTELDDDVRNLGKFGHINNRTGKYSFTRCGKCLGPILGHKVEEAACKNEPDSNLMDAIIEEIMKNEVESWDRGNKDTPIVKYNDLIESLKKNNDIKDYVVTVILDRTQEADDRSVDKILAILAEKYAKTTVETSKDILKEILEFEMK